MTDPLDQLRLRDLQLLEHVHSLGTLKQVAQALFVTQPAITQMLKGLERAFGLPLVERGRRGVRLNAAGQAALVRLRCARHELSLAREAARETGRPLLRLGATPIASLQLLSPAVLRMRERLPTLRLTLSEGGVESLWRELAEGALDALVGRLPGQDPQFARAHGLRHETVDRHRLVLVCARSHPLAAEQTGRASRAFKQRLADADWVLPAGDGLSMMQLNEWFAQSGVTPPGPKVVSGSIYSNLNLAAGAGLLTVVPESAARAVGPALGLTILKAGWHNPTVDLVFAARATQWDSPMVQTLRGCFGAEPAESLGSTA
jgi:DNA-binding transcriptional LysR family regulator